MKRPNNKEREPAPPAPKGGFRHGDRAQIPEAALSPRERKVLTAIRSAGRPVTVRELGRRCFPGMRAKLGTYEVARADGSTVRHATAPAYRCVLNSLRRLVAGAFVRKVDRGTYVAEPARAS